jgi:restriction endonuclease Mrr
MNILNVVIRVLKDHQGPTHFKTIAKEITEQDLVENTGGQTIETLVNANVGIDIKALESSGKLPRFQKLENGFIALTESAYDTDIEDEDFNKDENYNKDNQENQDEEEGNFDKKFLEHHDVLQIIDDYKYSVSKEFARHLNNIDFTSFEKLFNNLIRSFPIKRSTIVNRRKDGGMDYAINMGFFKNNMNLLVATRRWGLRKNVTMEEIDDIFDRMKNHGFNALIFVTTGEFDKEVYEFLEGFKDIPFYLINGEKLAWLMMERGIGVRPSKVNLYRFNPNKHNKHHQNK